MANIVTTGSMSKRLWPGVKIWYGEKYKSLPKEYEKLFKAEKSDKRYEEIVNLVGMGAATVKAEGDAIQYGSFKQGIVTRMDNVVYATGFIMTHEVGVDDQYDMKLAAVGGAFMAKSLLATKETVLANIFNNGFSTSFPTADAAAFFSAAHTYGGVTFSNLTTAAALSEASIEQMCIDLGNQVEDSGIKMQVNPVSIHVPLALKYAVKRVLGTPIDQRPATADRDINALVSYNEDLEIHIHKYFTSSTAFFIKTDVDHGTILFEREALEGGEDNDFDTGNRKFKMMERYVGAVGDPRGWQGNAGA